MAWRWTVNLISTQATNREDHGAVRPRGHTVLEARRVAARRPHRRAQQGQARREERRREQPRRLDGRREQRAGDVRAPRVVQGAGEAHESHRRQERRVGVGQVLSLIHI